LWQKTATTGVVCYTAPMYKLAILLLIFFAIPSASLASVVINEVAWMGTPMHKVRPNQWWRYEWIELYNTATVSQLLDGWTVVARRANKPLDLSVSLAGSIAPRGYYLITASSAIKGSSVSYHNLSGKLANKGETLGLFNAKGKLLDNILAEQGWYAGNTKTKKTMERSSAEIAGDNPANWHTSATQGGTPGKANSIAQQTAPAVAKAPAEQKKNLPRFSLKSLINSPLPIALLLALVLASLALLGKRRF